MTIAELPDTVYHGTVSVYEDSIKEQIDISKGYPYVDFGQGFYTTSSLEQAKQIARARTNLYNMKGKPCPLAYPIVSQYRFNKMSLASKKKILFDSANEKWIEFVFNNRVGIDFSVTSYYNINKKYHIVYGCVADSDITGLVRNIRNGSITYGDFIDKIKPLKLGKYDQLSFHSDESLKALTFVDV